MKKKAKRNKARRTKGLVNLSGKLLSELLSLEALVAENTERAKRAQRDWSNEMFQEAIKNVFQGRYGCHLDTGLIDELRLLRKYHKRFKEGSLLNKHRREIARRGDRSIGVEVTTESFNNPKEKHLFQLAFHSFGLGIGLILECPWCQEKVIARETERHVEKVHGKGVRSIQPSIINWADEASIMSGSITFVLRTKGVVEMNVVDIDPQFRQVLHEDGALGLREFSMAQLDVKVRPAHEFTWGEDFVVQSKNKPQKPNDTVWNADARLPSVHVKLNYEVRCAWRALHNLSKGTAPFHLCSHCDALISTRTNQCTTCKERLKKRRHRDRAKKAAE